MSFLLSPLTTGTTFPGIPATRMLIIPRICIFVFPGECLKRSMRLPSLMQHTYGHPGDGCFHFLSKPENTYIPEYLKDSGVCIHYSSFLDSALTQRGLTGRLERMSVQHPQAMDVLGVQTSLGDE